MLGGIRLFLILASLLLLTAIVSASDSSNGSPQGPPQTFVRPVEETLHGHRIVDNYRWLEDGTTPETQAWVKSELAYTRTMLDPLPGRAGIENRLKELLSVGSISAPQIAGPYYLYTKREGMQNQPVLYVREGIDGKDRVLMDVNGLSADGTVALDWCYPSKDAKYVADAASLSGSEMSTLHVPETATGKALPDAIERARASSV